MEVEQYLYLKTIVYSEQSKRGKNFIDCIFLSSDAKYIHSQTYVLPNSLPDLTGQVLDSIAI